MNENPVKKLQALGQSVWLDNLSRNLLNSGQLKKWVDSGVTGITSNPTIFQKALAGSRDYDDSLRVFLAKGIRDDRELFFHLAIEDISRAADLLWPVYEATGGRDGYVSIEVSPDLAYDSEKTIAEAKHLFSTIGKKNILIKVPATPQGVPAIEKLTADGVNVNVTLLFSVKRYEEIAWAYIRALEKRSARGLPIGGIASVASFFVSRVDTLIDKLLETRQASSRSEAEKSKLKSLLGQAAVANARVAYQKYREIFGGPRFRDLKGARIQRILWGSTGTKNPAYSDVKYVDELFELSSHKAHFRWFGIADSKVQQNLTIILEPNLFDPQIAMWGVYPDQSRNRLIFTGNGEKGVGMPLSDWGFEFSENMPQDILDAILKARGDGDSTLEDEEYRKRLQDKFGNR